MWYKLLHQSGGYWRTKTSRNPSGAIFVKQSSASVTEYAFQVAAVNVNGSGPLSKPITLGGMSFHKVQ